MANFYNLPSAWNPGYAPYDPAEAEGLERRAITTQQLPNGTYDDPKVGAGGYAVPKSILQQGYGAGAAVTKWMPRGTVDGNPSWLTKPTSTWQLLGDDAQRFDVSIAGFGAAESYGQVANDPFTQYGQRAARLVMAKLARLPAAKRGPALKVVLDKVDPTLVSRASSAAKRAGSLEAGLAVAMSQGIRNEVVQLGRSKRVPSARSLLGLAAFGHAPAMGAVLEALGDLPIAGGNVMSSVVNAANTSYIEVGPFRFTVSPVTQTRYATDLNAQWKQWIIDQIKKANVMCQGHAPLVSASTYGLDHWIGMSKGQGVCPYVVAARGGGDVPLAIARNPVDGKKWGIFLYASKSTFEIYWKKLPNDALGSAFNWIASLPAKLVSVGKDVVGFAGDVLSGLKDLACDAVQNGGAAAAAASTGGVAGAAGAAAAATICTQAAPAPMPPPSSPPISTTTLLLLGGAAVAGYFLLTKKGS